MGLKKSNNIEPGRNDMETRKNDDIELRKSDTRLANSNNIGRASKM